MRGQNIVASASALVLAVYIQDVSPLGLTGLTLAIQEIIESFPAPQFDDINSSALSLLYGPTVTTIQDYWKNHSFDCMNLCWQSDVSAFLIC